MKLQPEFSAAGCNRSPESLAWARHGLLAYGSDRVVRLYDPQVWRRLAEIDGGECWPRLARFFFMMQ